MPRPLNHGILSKVPVMTIAEKHRRIQESLLTSIERPVLRWLAARMPGWILPDQLTALGVLGAALIPLGFGLSGLHRSYLWLVVAGFVINWFGDSLDGTVARYRHRERPRYGFFIDHTVDVINTAMMFLGFGLSPHADFRMAACAFIGYSALAQLSYINTIVSGEFRLSGGKFGPTEARVIGIAVTLALYFFSARILALPFSWPMTWLDLTLAAMAVYFLALFVTIGSQLAAGLAKLEP